MATTGFQRQLLERLSEGVRRRCRRALTKAIGKSLAMARKDLRRTAPVATGEYRSKINVPPLLVTRERIIAEIVFLAPHSAKVLRAIVTPC